MERRLKQRINDWINEFKCNIIEKYKSNEEPETFVKFIQNYNTIQITKEDFIKRKRTKNVVPFFERCIAKRSTGDQCTRRRKETKLYCGTHIKGAPHGTIENPDTVSDITKINVWQEEINGIIYYIDNNNNVYSTEDIFNNNVNPKIIAKYIKENDTYSIPCFQKS